MIVKETNKEKIESLIKEAEGRATQRLITYKDIERAIKKLENTLGIAKKDMAGIIAYIDINAQNFSNSYKFRASSTHIKIVCNKCGQWNLADVYRAYCKREKQAFDVRLTEQAKRAIIQSKELFGF